MDIKTLLKLDAAQLAQLLADDLVVKAIRFLLVELAAGVDDASRMRAYAMTGRAIAARLESLS